MENEMAKLIETFARMWIECDPNRGPYELGSGFHPDDCPKDFSGKLEGKPRWHWFIPRAEASIKYLQERGVVLTEQS